MITHLVSGSGEHQHETEEEAAACEREFLAREGEPDSAPEPKPPTISINPEGIKAPGE